MERKRKDTDEGEGKRKRRKLVENTSAEEPAEKSIEKFILSNILHILILNNEDFYPVPDNLTKNQLLLILRKYKYITKLDLSEWLNEQSANICYDSNGETLKDEEGLEREEEVEQDNLLKEILNACSYENGKNQICRLSGLRLDHTLVSFANIKDLPNLSNLRYISLQGNEGVSKHADFLLNFLNKTSNQNNISSIEQINLNETNLRFNYEDLNEFPKLPNLKELKIASSTINDEQFQRLIEKTIPIDKLNKNKLNKKISNIEVLDCEFTEITLTNINDLPFFPKLKKANFNHDDEADDFEDEIKMSDLLCFLQKTPRLEYLKCYYKDRNGERILLRLNGRNFINGLKTRLSRQINNGRDCCINNSF